MYANNTTQNRKPRGQSLVELALTLPVLLLLILGAMDFGRLYTTKITLTNAAREGANYLSRNPSETGKLDTVIASEVDNLTGYSVTYEFDGYNPGNKVSVTVTSTVDLIFSGFFQFMGLTGGGIVLSSTVEMMLR